MHRLKQEDVDNSLPKKDLSNFYLLTPTLSEREDSVKSRSRLSENGNKILSKSFDFSNKTSIEKNKELNNKPSLRYKNELSRNVFPIINDYGVQKLK